MEIIVLILIVIFALASSGKKNGKGGNAAVNERRKAAVNARRARPVRPASAVPKGLDEVKAAVNRLAEEAKAEVQAPVRPVAPETQGASMLADAECAGGSMPHAHVEGRSALADEECYGGSMEHTHTEGVSRKAHARHMAAIDGAVQPQDVLPEAIDARALRRAVVMAEVLGKPKALRKQL